MRTDRVQPPETCSDSDSSLSSATMQRCVAPLPHPHYESDDEDLFPSYGEFTPAKVAAVAALCVAAAEVDEEEMSPPVPARRGRKKRERKTSSPGWGGARGKTCDFYAEYLGPVQPTALTLRVWEGVDDRLRERKDSLARLLAECSTEHLRRQARPTVTMALAMATFTHPEVFLAGFKDQIVRDLIAPAKPSHTISTQTE